MNKINRNNRLGNLRGCYLSSFFSDQPYLTNFVDRLSEKGIKKFDDIEMMSCSDIFSKVKTTESNQKRFQIALMRLGVDLKK